MEKMWLRINLLNHGHPGHPGPLSFSIEMNALEMNGLFIDLSKVTSEIKDAEIYEDEEQFVELKIDAEAGAIDVFAYTEPKEEE